jgi:HipA-like protein
VNYFERGKRTVELALVLKVRHATPLSLLCLPQSDLIQINVVSPWLWNLLPDSNAVIAVRHRFGTSLR